MSGRRRDDDRDGDEAKHRDGATHREHRDPPNPNEGRAGDDESFAQLMGGIRRLERGPARRPVAAPASTRSARDRTKPAGSGATPRFRWPDPHARDRAAAPGVSDAQLAALARGEPEPEERIDLHGTRRAAARDLIERRLESACARGLRCVLIVHGRGRHSGSGDTVLKDSLPDWLTRPANAGRVLAFTPAPTRLGGAGATLVLLRRRR